MATPFPTDSAQPVLLMTRARDVAVPSATIAADAVVSEQHSSTNTITDHPVETGFNPSDHSRPEPDRLSVEMYVSDTPLSVDQMQRAQKFMQQAGLGALLGNQSIANVRGYSRAVRDKLQAYRAAGTVLTVATAIKTYTSMMIESISETRTAQDAEAFHATVTFKEIRIVQNKLTRKVVAKDPRAQPKVKTGQQTPTQNAVEQSALDAGYENAKTKSGVIGKTGGFITGALGLGGT